MSAYVSAFELFSVGVGPSSSHTVGPMRAALDFATRVAPRRPARVTCALYGSLGATGLGHGTPDAIVAGLQGHRPETVEPAVVRGAWSGWRDGDLLALDGVAEVVYSRDDVQLQPRERKPGHPNALTLTALDAAGAVVAEETYYSIGGGFIRREGEPPPEAEDYPLAFSTAASLLALCELEGLSIAEVARRNEEHRRPAAEVDLRLDGIWRAMADCIAAGLHATGSLPGALGVRRRAAMIREQLESDARSPVLPGEWLATFALAVNEENASGGRVVTAPTNGAAGILPAVAQYWARFVCPTDDPTAGMREFLLTATALGSLFKANASISGAEGGCQAEVGSACAMAAGGLTAVMGGTPSQVENAAEIAIEHHLGLTCDPVGGLVQIPCIERNAIAASTAVTAARLAMRGDGSHYVSLDTVVETMRQTGMDMSTKYKETSEGGLAVNVVEC
ncbi:L-serine dehydratase [Microbacteriaceae bacterium SG_E_30_P1]|uniref:L-serine dehydratase n=1 Tax=Antiquaquibacter oligotrophicus TaxID=2880260 RepID=A0ABT6KJV7_9MICO|nr:L-serine ammonia-lyase [Antiquaquibacter oligotrophicus]MDH6180094.1 L-serine dehydratase [Antiquaquibacter oligotrophicus]UDF14155.1 L-serine ammonia-lyase [Antiquaquibacter oligotrophicus]